MSCFDEYVSMHTYPFHKSLKDIPAKFRERADTLITATTLEQNIMLKVVDIVVEKEIEMHKKVNRL